MFHLLGVILLYPLPVHAAETGTGWGPLYTIATPPKLVDLDPDAGATIVFNSDIQEVRMNVGMEPAEGIAWGYVRDTLAKTGWIEVHMQTSDNPALSNDLKQYSAGFIEGTLTAARMSQFYSNFYQLLLKDATNKAAIENIKHVFHDELEFVMKNINFVPGSVSQEPADPYWKQARYVMMQLHGMLDGYNTVALQTGVGLLSMVDMLMINSHSDMGELMEAYSPKMVQRRRARQGKRPGGEAFVQKTKTGLLRGAPLMPDFEEEEEEPDEPLQEKTYDEDWERMLTRKGHCTAFVRLTKENKDLLVGHTTWDDYSKLTKMFKYYDFALPTLSTAATKIAMSSYPGCVSSTDDWYMLSSGLVVADTTLEILNPTLYERIPEFPSNAHIPNFLHIMIVNRMAQTAAHWIVLFSERNSGTYNAQWLVIDYNQFKVGEPLRDNTFWVLEQVPGAMNKADMSFYLRSNGYFASYNRPHFQDIRKVSGHEAAEMKFGPIFSWDSSPRAQIFQSVAPNVDDLTRMRSVMQRNDFPNEEAFKNPPGRAMDPIDAIVQNEDGTLSSKPVGRFADGNILSNEPGHAIAARMDLDSTSRLPNGAIDSKIINRCLFRNFQCQAISGPTHEKQEVFRWRDGNTDLFPGWPHLGLPNVWDFEWVQMTPSRQIDKPVDIATC